MNKKNQGNKLPFVIFVSNKNSDKMQNNSKNIIKEIILDRIQESFR